MERLAVIIGALLIASFAVVNGLLMAAFPTQFLRFFDLYTSGDYVARTGSWRNDVGSVEFKIAGVVIMGFGAFLIWTILSRFA